MSHAMKAAVDADRLDDIPKGYRATALAVFSRLAEHHNATTGQCNPRVATIAQAIRRSEDSVGRALALLAKAGRITRERRYGASGWRVADGYVLTPRPSNADGPLAVTVTPSLPDTDSPLTRTVRSRPNPHGAETLTRMVRSPNPHGAGALESGREPGRGKARVRKRAKGNGAHAPDPPLPSAEEVRAHARVVGYRGARATEVAERFLAWMAKVRFEGDWRGKLRAWFGDDVAAGKVQRPQVDVYH
jgi:hypothetical protein